MGEDGDPGVIIIGLEMWLPCLMDLVIIAWGWVLFLFFVGEVDPGIGIFLTTK